MEGEEVGRRDGAVEDSCLGRGRRRGREDMIKGQQLRWIGEPRVPRLSA